VGPRAEEPALAPLDESFERALIVVAHPDDVDYSGLGAAAHRWTARGKHVAYLVCSRGEAGIDALEPEAAAPLRCAEQLAAARAVGVRAVEFAEFADGAIEYSVALRCRIAAAIRRHRPGAVFTLSPHARGGGGGLNLADHRVVARAALDAVRDAANRWVCRELLREGLEPWHGVHLAACATSPRPTHALDLTGSVEAGVAGLLEHRAYLASVGSPEGAARALRASLAAAGTAAGCEAALALEVLAL